MQPSFFSLLTDTKNFITNHFILIISSLIIVALCSNIVLEFSIPSPEEFEPINLLLQKITNVNGEPPSMKVIQNIIYSLPEQEKATLTGALFTYFMLLIIILFSISIVTTLVIVSLIFNLSHRQFSITNFFKYIPNMLISIVLFELLGTLCCFIFVLIFLLLAPIMMVLLIPALFFYFCWYFLFLAVVIEHKNTLSFYQKIIISLRTFGSKRGLVFAIIGLWILCKIILMVFLSLPSSEIIASSILYTVELLINFIAICYCYRLYSLTRES